MSARPERRLDPVGLGALVATGTLGAHQLGYVADGGATTMHEYLGIVGPAVLMFGFVAAWTAALRILRHDGGRAPSLAQLSALQVALFVAMEAIERLATGSLGTIGSTPVVLGLLAQPLVAFVALRVLRRGGKVLESLVAVTSPGRPTTTPLRPTAPLTPTTAVPRSAIRLRGPPIG